MSAAAALARKAALGGAVILWSVGPVAWMAMASMRDRRDLLRNPDSLIPGELSWRAYAALLSDRTFVSSFTTSLELAGAATCVTLALAFACAYALARFRVAGMGFVRQASLWAYLFPPIVIVIPLAILMRAAGIQGTFLALLLAHVAFCFPFAMWLLYPFLRGLPAGLEEQAAVDGAAVTATLQHVVLPLARPGLVAVAAFCFALSWSDYLMARVLLGSSLRTLPLFIYDQYDASVVDWGTLLAAGTLSVVPSLALVAFGGRHIADGFARAGIRGEASL